MKNFSIIISAIFIIGGILFRFFTTGHDIVSYILVAVGVLIFLFSFLAMKKCRKTIIALSAIILAGTIAFGIIEIPIISASRTDENPQADYLIVLGAGVNGTYPSMTLRNRLDSAYEYLTSYPQAKAVVSGGQGSGEDVTEAYCMKKWLTEKGISADRIIEEDKSTSTIENLKFSNEKIIADSGNSENKIAVLSSEYHLYRAKEIAKSIGIDAKGVAGHTSLPVMKINYFIREGIAVTYMKIFGTK